MVAAGSAPSCPRQGSGEIGEIFMKLYGVSFPDSMGCVKKEYEIELLSLPCLRVTQKTQGCHSCTRALQQIEQLKLLKLLKP